MDFPARRYSINAMEGLIPMKRNATNHFDQYKLTLTKAEADGLEQFLADLDRHVTLSRRDGQKIRLDFESALLYYASCQVPLAEALNRLSIKKLGGFYARPAVLWYALDNAAKIYPLSMKHGQMAVFRLSIRLKEDVVPEILQMALSFSIKRFPGFATTVKKGFFWHYLDTAKRRYSVEQESDIPCRPLKVARSGSQSFRVLYYKNRISVEYFHILTDGAGGMTFLKTLAAEYLRLLGVRIPNDSNIPDINDAPAADEMANEFPRAGAKEGASGFVDKPAVQMSGKISKLNPCRIIQFRMDAALLKDAAKSKGATVTEYMLAVLFAAGRYATDETEGNASIQVPVNMRKFYPSNTLRNFSMYCGIRLPLPSITDIDSIIEEIGRQLRQKASKECMGKMINATNRMVGAIRYVPLFIKSPVVKIAYGFLGNKIFSNTFSNLGVVKLPPEMAAYVHDMDFVLATGSVNRASCAMVTFENTATLSISKSTADPSFEERVYDLLIEDGITPIVEGSELYEG